MIESIFDFLDHGRRLKEANDSGNLNIPAIKSGNQLPKFEINQEIVATSSSTRKAGTKGKIIDLYQENGYWYYITDNLGVQRQQDIELRE
jgi:hypothetical protein